MDSLENITTKKKVMKKKNLIIREDAVLLDLS
jgi:hypothetical protein